MEAITVALAPIVSSVLTSLAKMIMPLLQENKAVTRSALVIVSFLVATAEIALAGGDVSSVPTDALALTVVNALGATGTYLLKKHW